MDKRWSDLVDTQGIIEGTIDIQYCLKEGKRLVNGQINVE